MFNDSIQKGSLGLLALVATAAGPVQAQDSQSGAAALRTADVTIQEVVVTARRREESLQDVPLTVNTVTAENLDDLQIRQFQDIESIVPGLNFQPDNLSPSVTMRGLDFSIETGGSPTVEFYLNDAPIIATQLLNTMYDIGQIEVLRGPQGTLRGRASPSGSITVTIRQPDLHAFGGFVNTTVSDIGGRNASAAFNAPLVRDRLALRVAALYDENERDGVKSIHSSRDPFFRTKSWRASLLAEPIDGLRLSLIYTDTDRTGRSFPQVESANLVNPALPESPVLIRAGDRRAVIDHGTDSDQNFEQINFQLEWLFAGQRLNYVGARHEMSGYSFRTRDEGDFFGPGFSGAYQAPGQLTTSPFEQESHEFRLSSAERLFGAFDYVIGALYSQEESVPSIVRPTLVVLGPAATPATPSMIVETRLSRPSKNEEQSLFGNLTWHVTDATEISAGLRYIDHEVTGNLIVSGNAVPGAAQDDSFTDTIYSASIKHNFTDDFMAYASYGTSWRRGLSVVGDFSLSKTPLQVSFQQLPPETSKTYEIGFKSNLLDRRARFNAALFYQEFDNYPYRPEEGVYYVNTTPNPAPPPAVIERVDNFNFVGAVPVKILGVELEAFIQLTDRWSLGGVFAYAKGEIDDGRIPCNDWFPTDGIPDDVDMVPSVGQIRAATGGDNLAACTVDYRSHNSPPWSAALQSEYTFLQTPGLEAYARGLLSVYGPSKGDPVNSVDNVDSYSILNLYFGLRDPKGLWEVSVYGKNIFETEKVLTRGASPYTASFTSVVTGSQTVFSSYRGITMTPEREFGLNLRYNFSWD